MGAQGYKRRKTWEVSIGGVTIGGDRPVAVQSMTSTSTMDTPGSVAQIERIADAGGDIVRLTAQGVREAVNLTEIRDKVRADGYAVPLVADIHFNPKAAFEAAGRVEKVRINPGNFVDPGRVFKKIDYTPEEYAEEITKIDEALVPLLNICRENGTALRIGVNHGSLSDRIMSRYGDTPEGMVESAMEFLRVCMAHDFRNVVISIKASNVVVMTRTVRLMAEAMDAEGMHFPLHLGVTEAGDAEDGRIKSATGIGSLLMDGLGDTIRVSLTENPENEIAPARAILAHIAGVASDTTEIPASEHVGENDAKSIRADKVTQVIGLDIDKADIEADLMSQSVEDILTQAKANPEAMIALRAGTPAGALLMRSAIRRMRKAGAANPVAVILNYDGADAETTAIKASIDLGLLLLENLVDAVAVENKAMTLDELNRLALNILQATRKRITKTEYIACPGCGRTLYDLHTALKEIKNATSHLKGLKIGVMGCIVNGPGEMADADYGYVGAGVGRVSLYKGKECVMKNLPTEEAIPALIELIRRGGDWKEPEE